ncbi:MAG: condensation domain-containing protein [Thermoguttaceae bacterium]
MISLSNDATGRLNAFQRLMLQWSELHPYSAVHIYKIAHPSNPEGLVDSIRNTYLDLGIGLVEVDEVGLSYRHRVDHFPEVTVVRGQESPTTLLDEHVTRELNRRFERPCCKPWRFGIVEAGANSHYLVLTYDHWVADSTAARQVLRHVLDRYCSWNRPENRPSLDLYPGTYREVFANRLGGPKLLGIGARAVQHWLRNHSTARIPYSSSEQMDIRFESHRTASDTVPRLRHFAHSLDATVHDVILAALGRAMAEHLPRRALRKKQPMALGTIVNARGESQEDLGSSLGAFLGYYLVRLASDKSLSLADAVRCVAATTGPIKSHRRYLDSLFNMKLASMVWPHLNATRKRHFMPTMLPLTAGVSNVLVRDDWMQESGSGDIVEYARGASTGPILPLVLTPTTWNGEMNVGVSYRIAGFSHQKIDGVVSLFLDQIEHPTGVPSGHQRGVRVATKRDEAPQSTMLAACTAVGR